MKNVEKKETSKEPLLTDEEKGYLKAVVEPFKNTVKYIVSDGYTLKINLGQKFIDIEIPILYNSFFQNLKEDKHYTLKELGLD